MGQLAEIQHFVRLDLSNTAVTDAGLEKLVNVPLLLNLRLAGTRVTPAGVERFKTQHLANAEDKSKFQGDPSSVEVASVSPFILG